MMKIGRKELVTVDVNALDEDSAAAVRAQLAAHNRMMKRQRPTPLDTVVTLAPGGDVATADTADHIYDERHPRSGEIELVVVDENGRKRDTGAVTL